MSLSGRPHGLGGWEASRHGRTSALKLPIPPGRSRWTLNFTTAGGRASNGYHPSGGRHVISIGSSFLPLYRPIADDGRPVHDAPGRPIVIGRIVLRQAVVPKRHIVVALLPAHHEFRFRAVCVEHRQQCAAFGRRQFVDVGGESVAAGRRRLAEGIPALFRGRGEDVKGLMPIRGKSPLP